MTDEAADLSADEAADIPANEAADLSADQDADIPANEAADISADEAADIPAPSPFAALGLDPQIVTALEALGYEEPTPIQERAIPLLLAGRDVIGRAATGTGKTAAFALPLVQRIDNRAHHVQALVMAPTRELAVQVAEATHKYGQRLGVRVLAVYGGQDISRQLRELRRGVHVIVGTPGRLLDHIRRGSLDLSATSYVVLDEADEMLDMGFIDDIEAIIAALPDERQTALFSATFPPRIQDLARRALKDPERVVVTPEKLDAPLVRQVAYLVNRGHKLEALARILDVEAATSAIIFCRTRTEVDELTEALAVRGHHPEALHGGLAQAQRDRVMGKFRQGTADILIATDVAARGLDVEHVSHVINYDIPQTPEAYVHRIGRTGRAGREGTAVTLVVPREKFLLRAIERQTGQPIEHAKVPRPAEVRARRRERLRDAIRAVLTAGDDLDPFREVVRSLAEEFDPLEVAAAAARVAAEHLGTEEMQDETEIPDIDPRDRDSGPPRDPRRGEGGRSAARGGGTRRGPGAGKATLYIGIGRRRGVRPADIVGAIAGEANVPGDRIGAIEITDQFTLVDVDEGDADRIVQVLSGASIRGRQVPVRRSREDRGEMQGGGYEGGGYSGGGGGGGYRGGYQGSRDGGSRPYRGGRDGGSRPSRGKPYRRDDD